MTPRIRRWSILIMVSAGLVLGGTLAACSGAEGAKALGATCDDFTKQPSISQTAEVKVGEEISVVLCSNPSTGYSWQDPTISDPAVVSLAATGYREPQASAGVVGAAGSQRITLRGIAPGTSTVDLQYSRPWEGGEQGTWTYQLTVTVK